jgi:hypothetical protein
MQQVADWLEKLGLGQYAERFAENDISFVVMPKIGVASLGHRHLLLRAIGELDSIGEGGGHCHGASVLLAAFEFGTLM